MFSLCYYLPLWLIALIDVDETVFVLFRTFRTNVLLNQSNVLLFHLMFALMHTYYLLFPLSTELFICNTSITNTITNNFISPFTMIIYQMFHVAVSKPFIKLKYFQISILIHYAKPDQCDTIEKSKNIKIRFSKRQSPSRTQRAHSTVQISISKSVSSG